MADVAMPHALYFRCGDCEVALEGFGSSGIILSVGVWC